MSWLLRLWLLLLVGALSKGACAEEVQRTPRVDAPITLAWWADVAGSAQLADLAQQPFQPFKGSRSLGNSQTVVWIRVGLPALPEGQWVLLVQPPMIQDAEVFVQEVDGHWHRQRLGLAHAAAQRSIQVLNLAVPLPASDRPRQAYVRVRTATSALQVSLLPQAEVYEQNGLMLACVGLYAGLTLAFALLSLVCWALTRDGLWGVSCLFDLGTLVMILTQMGVVSRYWMPHAQGVMDHVLVFVVCSQVALSTLMFGLLIRRFTLRRWLTWPYWIVAVLYPIELWLMSQGMEAHALRISNASVMLLCLFGLFVCVCSDHPDWLLRWGLRALCLILALYLLYNLAPVVLVLPPPAMLHFYPAAPSNLVSVASAAMLLMRAAQLRARTAHQEEQRRLLAERDLAHSRQQQAETSGLMSMLLHEVRTPLALIQTATRAISSGRAADAAGLQKMTQRIDDAVRNVTGVLEHCIEVDRLEHGQLAPQQAQLDAAAELRTWLAKRPVFPRVQLDAPVRLAAWIDLQLWLSMVGNLLENAVKYSPPESPIRMSLADEGGQLALSVSNTAGDCGLPDATRLFQKYYRAEGAARISGTGLGLYWVKVLSQRLGGDVRYVAPQSSEAQDAEGGAQVTFCLLLPTVEGVATVA